MMTFARSVPRRSRRSVFVVALASLLGFQALVSTGCTESEPPGPGPDPPTLSFRIDTMTFAFEGTGSWPPSGSGVLVRTDTAATMLQVAAYRQTFAKRPSGTPSSVPESRYDIFFAEIQGSPTIGPGVYTAATAAAGFDIPVSSLDSLGFTGTVSLEVTSYAGGRAAGMFSGELTRAMDSAAVSIAGGAFEASVGTPALTFGDTGTSGGSIAITVGSGTAPAYAWEGGPVYAVSVARAATPTALVWGILTAGGDSIATGVTHGSAPVGVSLLANTEPVLSPGVAYRVTVSRVGGAYGFRVFVP